jgi:uncharacterized membrane protein
MREQVLFSSIGVVSILTGIPLAQRRIPRNRWYGLRVPATFADEHVWYEANAVCGRDFVALGCALLLVALGLPRVLPLSRPAYALACSVVLGAGSVVCAARGWRLANRLLRDRRESPSRA